MGVLQACVIFQGILPSLLAIIRQKRITTQYLTKQFIYKSFQLPDSNLWQV